MVPWLQRDGEVAVNSKGLVRVFLAVDGEKEEENPHTTQKADALLSYKEHPFASPHFILVPFRILFAFKFSSHPVIYFPFLG